uniref:Uncharacterized protein n=1 Tax=Mandrillus leucophaeus TaxID=9568 RepID=A0A2K5ZU03_MANLE
MPTVCWSKLIHRSDPPETALRSCPSQREKPRCSERLSNESQVIWLASGGPGVQTHSCLTQTGYHSCPWAWMGRGGWSGPDVLGISCPQCHPASRLS